MVLRYAYLFLSSIFFSNPIGTWWSFFVLLAVRAITAGLILRTYLGPWALAQVSRHIRVRSISLRSIRGVYFRRGRFTCQVERIRISYHLSRFEGSGRVSFKVEGLNLDVGSEEVPSTPSSPDPDNVQEPKLGGNEASWFEVVAWKTAYALDPLIRPMARIMVVSLTRLVVKWLPSITQMLEFTFVSPVIKFSDFLDAQATAEELYLRCSLEFSQMETIPSVGDSLKAPHSTPSISSADAWRQRLSSSANRVWNKAWGQVIVTGRTEFKARKITMSAVVSDEFEPSTIIEFPGNVGSTLAIRFSPGLKRIVNRSVDATLNLGEFCIMANHLRSAATAWKSRQTRGFESGSSADLSTLEAIPECASPEQEDAPSPLPEIKKPPPPRKSRISRLSSRISRNSQFFEALSASMMPRSKQKSLTKLSSPPKRFRLDIFSSAHLEISACIITDSRGLTKGEDWYEAVFQNIEVSSHCGAQDKDQGHTRWVGRRREFEETLDNTEYETKVSVGRVTLDRKEPQDRLRLVTLGSIEVKVLVSQWPSPWLLPNRFITGDPNGPLLIVNASLQGIDLTESLDELSNLLSSIPTREPQRKTQPRLLHHIPRVIFEISCGAIRASLLCPNSLPNGKPLVGELRTEGFMFSASSYFGYARQAIAEQIVSAHHSAVHMTYSFRFHAHPIFLRVRSRWHVMSHLQQFTNLGEQDPEFLEDPLLMSCDSIQLVGSGSVLGHVDESQSDNTLDLASNFTDLHCYSDFFSVELWHSDVMALTRRILSALEVQHGSAKAQADGPASRLPTGLDLSLSIGRCVVFLTTPDINPKETLAISRGLAARSAISVYYSSLRSVHSFFFQHLLTRSANRHKLSLVDEPSLNALNSAKASPITREQTAHISLVARNLVLRSALATQYSPDDPDMAERDISAFDDQEILRLDCIEISCCIGRMESAPHERCDANIHVYRALISAELLHTYNGLLALRALRSILPQPVAPKQPQRRNRLPLSVQLRLNSLEILCKLPQNKIQAELHELQLHYSTAGSLTVQWSLVCAHVLVPQVNRWATLKHDRWEELATIHHGHVSVAGTKQDPIAVRAQSLRLRVPFGFVFADLILDISVVAKACKHLYHVVPAGNLTSMPSPEAEPAKNVPPMSFGIDHVSLEAADDDFESRLGLIWRAGHEAAKYREDREQAFMLKVAAIAASADSPPSSSLSALHPQAEEYDFNSDHIVSVQEARFRLDQVHYLDWKFRHESFRGEEESAEATISKPFSPYSNRTFSRYKRRIRVHKASASPPLFRGLIENLRVSVSPPTFQMDQLAKFLHQNGHGLPLTTSYSLLVPMHLQVRASSLRVNFRNYPLPLFNAPSGTTNGYNFEFSSNLVVAEEMGTEASVDWVPCQIMDEDGSNSLIIDVPKTIMPVKTYADATVVVSSPGITTIAWGVSYAPATQDLMRVLDSLTSSPRDSSPALGFWDKLRLVCHWKLKTTFLNGVRFHMKGSRSPFDTEGPGAGFALSWKANTELLVGHHNDDHELVQVLSESMSVIVPQLNATTRYNIERGLTDASYGIQKICAQLSSGVCFGIGFFLERTCSSTSGCSCSGSTFQRQCRFFDFSPHYDVMLERKEVVPQAGSMQDSYRTFRSDFVHLSISLTSSLHGSKSGIGLAPSNLYLTPNLFAHFWSWWNLFAGVLSLPIRQGDYFPQRHLSPKLGRHLATLKYRIMVSKLFLFHAYMENNRDAWEDGVTPFVGVKALIDSFHADMHQREVEVTIRDSNLSTPQTYRRKPFYAAEVVLKGLDLRAVSAIVEEKPKQYVTVSAPGQPSNYRKRTKAAASAPPPPPSWVDENDFVDISWEPPARPSVHFIPVVSCPRFTYFKRTPINPADDTTSSKFGVEDSHTCLLGKEDSVIQIQVAFLEERIVQLQKELLKYLNITPNSGSEAESVEAIRRNISLLKDHIAHVKKVESPSHCATEGSWNYYMSSDSQTSEDCEEFDNVYQIHCPEIFLDRTVRDILMQYYYCSRARRGIEYHLATRAVKFIRDQAEVALYSTSAKREKKSGANLAAHALRKIIGGESTRSSNDSEEVVVDSIGATDPLDGWSEGVSLEKRHFGLLLKPQIVLRNEDTVDSLCIIAATEVKLQGYAIMDEANKDDPVSGKIMSRTFAKATGLQMFAPATATHSGDGRIPLEIFINARSDSHEFDRLVPQTTATLQYDKFNRLRLRNNITALPRKSKDKSTTTRYNHLHNQTDLVEIHVPQFTVIASDRHFQYISNIVTKLVLFSDAAHRTRLDALETLLFQYDFTDLTTAAEVITRLQHRIRSVQEELSWMETQRANELYDEQEYFTLSASLFVLVDELNTIFDTIQLAQDRSDDRTEQKSALLLHASSSEVSWGMLDRRTSLAKLAVRNPHFHWLSRQDSSMVNTVTIGDLQAFDTSPDAVWAEILCKHDEPSSNPMLKQGLFASAEWTVLAPVGGITIYEDFKADFHPMRVQIDARLGSRILEYLWPGRKERRQLAAAGSKPSSPVSPARNSLDSPQSLKPPEDMQTEQDLGLAPPPPLRRLGVSRSFTDLRSAAGEIRPLKRTRSISPLLPDENEDAPHPDQLLASRTSASKKKPDGAVVMKSRSSQKTFVHVHVSSLHLLLSIVKEDAFECRNAQIHTRELEYHNETLSFEELVNRFIPADLSWKGWVKMAFNQPLLPVLPVARELLSKTKFTKAARDTRSPIPFKNRRKKTTPPQASDSFLHADHTLTEPGPSFLTEEPTKLDADRSIKRPTRARVISLFGRAASPRHSDVTKPETSRRQERKSLEMRRSLDRH